MAKSKYAEFQALKPYTDLMRKGLGDLVDGDHFFDTISENALFEFLYDFPGWPRTIRGRANLKDAYSGCCKENKPTYSPCEVGVYAGYNSC